MGQRADPRRIGFDIKGFVKDLQIVCRNRGVTFTKMARDIGVSDSTLSYMKTQQRVPDGTHLAALGAWSGLDVRLYSMYVEDLT